MVIEGYNAQITVETCRFLITASEIFGDPYLIFSI